MTPKFDRSRFTAQAVRVAAVAVVEDLRRRDTAGRGVPVIMPSHRDTLGKPVRLILNRHGVYTASRWRWLGTFTRHAMAAEIEAAVLEWLAEYDELHRRGVDPACWMDPQDERL